MAATSIIGRRRERVERAFAGLTERFSGADQDVHASFEVRLGDVGRTWQVTVDGGSCSLRSPAPGGADVVIGTDSSTWIALREGRLSGLDAFALRRLYVQGDIDLSLAFEGLFDLPGHRPPHLRVRKIDAGGTRISTLTAHGGPEQVICIHGLGSDKTSFFETVAALTPACTVHAIDLPGFGSSDKPARAAYDAPYFARAVSALMDELGIGSAHLVGNSMGGRVALELALALPARVRSISLLAPALAFRRNRELVPLVKLLRPELASIPHPLRQAQVRRQFWSLFARPERLDPALADIASEEFLRVYRCRAARVAFYSAARNIYLDHPWGAEGLWRRLERLRPPALFVWGDSDALIPAGFSRHVSRALPSARQAILPDCGHVPQVELPEQTTELIEQTIAAASPIPASAPTTLGAPRLRARFA